MRPGWLLSLVLFASLLAGCASSPDDGAPPAGGPQNVVTDPLDYSYMQNATPGSHIHDYWQGRDRVIVLESDSRTGFGCGGCNEGATVSIEVPEDGVIVPQGTRWVNGTFTLDPEGENTWSHLELWLRTAAEAEAQRIGPLESGVPFSIESTRERNDPPHYILSLWEFQVRAFGPDGDFRLEGSMAWRVEAVRGLPLEPYPPHPDRWGGATELDLLQETRSSTMTLVQRTPTGTSYSCYNGCPGEHRLGDGVVVPFETRTVEARLAYGAGVPAGLTLWFHGSDTRTLAPVEGTIESPGVVLFAIPVAAGVADSPYATQSLWEFVVALDPVADGQPLEAWSGEYTLTVKALR